MSIKQILWSQLMASAETLENSITACPDDLWGSAVTEKSWQECWYLASHTIFWLDWYMSEDPEHFTPPAPFGLEEMDPAGVLPPRVYTKDELLTYLAYCRERCRARFAPLTDETIVEQRFVTTTRKNLSLAELVIYVTRHNQHHAAQMNLLLRQHGLTPPTWVSRGKP
jgi:hypothetical protein